MKRYSFFLIGSLLFCLVAQAQKEKVKLLPLIAVRADIGIPKSLTSQAFHQSMLGVYEINAGIDFHLFDNFFVGVGYQNSIFKNETEFQKQGLNTRMQVNNIYVKLGYDHFFADKAFYTISLNAGYNMNHFIGINQRFDTLPPNKPSGYSGVFLEPSLGLNFLVEQNFSIGIHLSYVYNSTRFDPAYGCLDRWKDYTHIKEASNTTWLSFGFGFYYGFGERKR